MKGLSNMPEVIPNFELIELDLNIHLNDFKLYTLFTIELASMSHLLKAWTSKR